MKGILRTEIYKAFTNKLFCFSVLLGTAFVLLSAFDRISIFVSDSGFLHMVEMAKERETVKYPIVPASTLYNSWIGGESQSLGYTLFFMLYPLLAILPYGHSFSEEVRSGYVKVIMPKCGRKNYFLAKTIAAFLSGGAAIVIPSAISLLLCAMVFPAAKPNVIYDQYFQLGHENMLAGLGNTHPLIYMLFYLFIDFVYAGLYACLSIVVVFFFKQRFSSVIIPFLFALGCDSLRSFLAYISYVEISPLLLTHDMPVAYFIKAPVLFAWICFFSAVSIPIIFVKGRKYEII